MILLLLLATKSNGAAFNYILSIFTITVNKLFALTLSFFFVMMVYVNFVLLLGYFLIIMVWKKKIPDKMKGGQSYK
jgi:hypothetical protein